MSVCWGRRLRIGTLKRLAGGLLTLVSHTVDAGEFIAGEFRFSDELGGFRIVGISGSGSVADPIILEEEIYGTAPISLVIRRMPHDHRTMPKEMFALTKTVRNRSKRVWGGFELELREVQDSASGDEDGLSFSQMDVKSQDVSSDRFANSSRLFKSRDIVLFRAGYVNPGEDARFSVVITDTTPTPTFFLVQTPHLLSAHHSYRGAPNLALGRQRDPRRAE